MLGSRCLHTASVHKRRPWHSQRFSAVQTPLIHFLFLLLSQFMRRAAQLQCFRWRKLPPLAALAGVGAADKAGRQVLATTLPASMAYCPPCASICWPPPDLAPPKL